MLMEQPSMITSTSKPCLSRSKDWKIMMEYQKSKATEEEWNKLK